jgi:hypothetical protein
MNGLLHKPVGADQFSARQGGQCAAHVFAGGRIVVMADGTLSLFFLPFSRPRQAGRDWGDRHRAQDAKR